MLCCPAAEFRATDAGTTLYSASVQQSAELPRFSHLFALYHRHGDANQRANRNLDQFLSTQAEKVEAEAGDILSRASGLRSNFQYPAQGDSLVHDAYRLLLEYRENPKLDSNIIALEQQHEFLNKK